MFLNYGFSFTSSALLLKHKKPPKDLFSATCSVLSLNVTAGEHSESLQDFNTVSDQCFKQHAHISAPIKVQLSRSAAGWCEESLIVTSPWTRRQRERGSVISGERKALTRLGSRGQRLHMELTSCQVVLSRPDYETADVYTHTETDSHQTCGGCEDVCHVILVVLFLFPDIFSLYADDSLFFLTVLCLFVVTLRLVVAALCLHVVIF